MGYYLRRFVGGETDGFDREQMIDVAEQVRAQNGKGVTFIQQELYQDNDPGKPVRPLVARWRLPTEPWAFVIDRQGKIASRFEGVFSVGELARAVAQVK